MMLLFFSNLAVCTALLVHALCVINHMTRTTNHLIRLAYILLAVGGLGGIVAPFYGYSAPLIADAIIKSGAALALIVGTYRRQKRGWPQ